MSRHFIPSLLLLAAAALPGLAITARNYDDALHKAGDRKAVVLFCYGANYDKVSEQRYEEFIKKRKIMPAVRSCVFMEVPIYQLPSDKEKKETARIMGKHSLPGGIWSYPCLAVLDGDGNLRGIVQSADEMKDAEAAGKALGELLESFKEQESLLSKAARASSNRKATLLAMAADIDLNMPSDVSTKDRRGREIKDKIGIKDRLKFDPLSVVEKLQPMSGEQANAYVRGLMANGCYSRRQRQEMMAAYAGHMRRNGASSERLRALYTEMRNIDPKSMYAAYAEEAIRLWASSSAPASGSASPSPAPGGRTAMGDTTPGGS